MLARPAIDRADGSISAQKKGTPYLDRSLQPHHRAQQNSARPTLPVGSVRPSTTSVADESWDSVWCICREVGLDVRTSIQIVVRPIRASSHYGFSCKRINANITYIRLRRRNPNGINRLSISSPNTFRTRKV